MPAVSKKQQRYFGYLLSNPEERKKKGISKKAAKDFAQDIQEVSPPGWGHTKAEKEKTKPWKPKSKIGGSAAAFKRALDDGRFKGLPGSTTKKEKTADMFKLMWSMKKKGDKPHYKPGTDKKYKKYQEESTYEKLKKKIGSKKMHKEPVVVEGIGDAVKKGVKRHKDAVEKKKIKNRKAVPYAALAAEHQPEGEVVLERDYSIGAKESEKFHTFYKKAKAAKAKKRSEAVTSDSRKHGIKFSDAKGSGRMRGGKKYYN